MSVFVDVLLAVVFLGIVFVYYHRGFARSILMLARVAISTLITFVAAPRVAAWIAAEQEASLEIPIYLITYALLFALTFVVMTIVTWQVGKLVRLPVLKQCDKILGSILGVVIGFVAVAVISSLLYLVLRLTDMPEIYENSMVFKLLKSIPGLPIEIS